MKKINVDIEWQGDQQRVGILEIFASRGIERYQFTYEREWTRKGFAIDPALELIPSVPYMDNKLWGVFQDISPDRWGRLVQSRVNNSHLSESDFMLGVSDHMRMGALRLSHAEKPEIYLADNTDVPKLIHLRELEVAVHRLEAGKETSVDLAIIAQPGSSLGGAHPKASIEDNGALWLAKFQSNTDTERISLWEATMLVLANKAGICTAHHRILNTNGDRPVLLVKRFDRQNGQRIPFMSAMTLLERNESTKDNASYLEIADAITRYSSQPEIDSREMFTRMTFNAMVGNTDDHLRNHAFLRQQGGWRLSPAYDINPTPVPSERRNHALSFDGERSKPSLDTCIELAEFFGLNKKETNLVLGKIAGALTNWKNVARLNGLHGDEISRMECSFEHSNKESLMQHTQKSSRSE